MSMNWLDKIKKMPDMKISRDILTREMSDEEYQELVKRMSGEYDDPEIVRAGQEAIKKTAVCIKHPDGTTEYLR